MMDKDEIKSDLRALIDATNNAHISIRSQLIKIGGKALLDSVQEAAGQENGPELGDGNSVFGSPPFLIDVDENICLALDEGGQYHSLHPFAAYPNDLLEAPPIIYSAPIQVADMGMVIMRYFPIKSLEDDHIIKVNDDFYVEVEDDLLNMVISTIEEVIAEQSHLSDILAELTGEIANLENGQSRDITLDLVSCIPGSATTVTARTIIKICILKNHIESNSDVSSEDAELSTRNVARHFAEILYPQNFMQDLQNFREGMTSILDQ